MKKIFKIFILFGAVLFITIALIFIVNQTLAITNLISGINVFAGQIVLIILLIIYAVCIFVPIIMYFRLPNALKIPEDKNSKEYEVFRKKLTKRLASNKLVKENGLIVSNNDSELERALNLLSKESDIISTKCAKHVFIATAISQNGRLDGLVVLAVQTRLIWRIAHTYYQRPSLREMLNLYFNVLLTAFVAVELQDMDISDQMEPLMSSVLGSAVGAIPGAKVAASVLIDSGLTGAANAFLTLRVGMITKKYCGSMIKEKRGVMRRSASAEAAKVLGSVVSEGMKKVAIGIAKATGSKVTWPITSIYGHTKNSVKDVFTRSKRRKDYIKSLEEERQNNRHQITYIVEIEQFLSQADIDLPLQQIVNSGQRPGRLQLSTTNN